MSPPHKPFIPKEISEIRDYLSMMMLDSPSFVDRTGYFPGRNLEVAFQELNSGLLFNRGKLGEALFLQLKEMSNRMREHFEADPENKTDDTLKGRALIAEMQGLLKRGVGKS